MGIEMFVFGFRKLKEEEIDELQFMKRGAIEKSDYWRNFFPTAPYGSGYWLIDEWDLERYSSIKKVLSPIETADRGTVYACWRERLGYYWHKDSAGRAHIEAILDSTEMNWDDAYHVVPYVWVAGHLDVSATIPEEEIIAFCYG